MSTQFITNKELHTRVITPVFQAKSFVWIGTADIKDLHVKHQSKFVSFLKILDLLVKKGVSVRLLHAKVPGEHFKNSMDKYPVLIKNAEFQLCPRVHFKQIIIDGKLAYTGSANLTGAGLGIKSKNKRNFESGLVTTYPDLIKQIMQQFDEVWMGKFCKTCQRRQFCPNPIA